MTREDVFAALAARGAEPPDDDGIVGLVVQGETLHVAPTGGDDATRFAVRAALGSVADIESPADFFEDFLAGGLFGLETAGAVPSVADDAAYLTAFWDAADFADADELVEKLDDLAFAVKDWRVRLEVHGGGEDE